MVQKRYRLDLEIINKLLKSENHIRGIAKELNESHTTILRKINNLLEWNIIDYKNIGRNKIFFLKKNLFSKNKIFEAEIYKLDILLEQYPKLQIIISEILNNCSDNIIVLFGSYAKGISKQESDIDIYIETRSRKTKEDIEKINPKLSIKIGEFNLESNLVKEIMKNHIILKGVDDFYERIGFLK